MISVVAHFPSVARADDRFLDQIRLRNFPTHGRLILRIDDGIPVRWKSTASGFEALLQGVSFTDLGAPLGSEAQWADEVSRKLEASREDVDGRIATVSLRETPQGVVIRGTWKFPVGPGAPAHPRMQSFGYREENPGRYIVDFWLKPGITVAEAEAERRQRERSEARRKAAEALKARIDRRIASEEQVKAARRVDAFCDQPLSDRRDVFLSFKPAHEPVDYFDYLPSTTPDSQFTYPEPSGDGKDARYARLALDLYNKGKNALVIRTLDFLASECPKSSYRQEMLFLRANALIKLGLGKEADRLLFRLRSEAKGSPEALKAGMYLAGRLVAENRPLAASEAFLRLAGTYPHDRLTWLFHLGAAEALFSIRQVDGAAREYEWVVKNGPNDQIKADAAARLGDLSLERREFGMALAAYSNDVRVFKAEAGGLPALYLNRAEALYDLGQFSEARKILEDYLRKFSNDYYPEGWRATFRLGEILGRLDGAQNQAASRRYFYDTINHYPFSPGSTLARLRLIPCGDHGGYDAKAAERFFATEAKSFDWPDQVSMVHYRDLYSLARLRFLVGMKRYKTAVDVATRDIPRARLESVRQALRRLLATVFRSHIEDLLDKGKRYEALDFYNDHEDALGHDIGAGDPGYLLRLSGAASDLGLGRLAFGIAAQYRNVAGNGPDSGRKPASGSGRELPLDERLQASERKLADAKALWVGGGATEAGARTQARVRELLGQVTAELPGSYEKEVILGLMDEKAGKLPDALAHALQAQLLLPEDTSGQDALRIEGWLASLEARCGNPSTALGMYRNLEKDIQDPDGKKTREGEVAVLGVPEAPDLGTVLLAQGAILEKQGRWSRSASLYSEALKKGIGGNQMAYSYARALLRTRRPGVREKAMAALEGVAASKEDDFWKRMAAETLEDLKIHRP